MKSLNIQEDTILTQITVTNGFFDGGVGTVNGLGGVNITSSSLSTTQKSYYYNLQYNSKDHFSVTYGHIAGSGSAEETSTTEGTTQAIYKQFFNFTEPEATNLRDSAGWSMIDGTDGANAVTQNDVYILAAERLQMKDRLNPGTFTLSLSGSLSDGGASTLHLTDNSKTSDATAAPFGEKYDIVSGSAGVQVGSTKYGFFYPDAGIFVLGANEVSASLPGTPAYKTETNVVPATFQGNGLCPDHRVVDGADNAHKLITAISKGSVTLRSEEKQFIYDYFCRAKANEFNYSQNLTFWSGSQYDIRHTDMINNPQVYITEVGLYDEAGDLMAIGRLSSALEKNFSSEAIVKVRLTY